MDLFVYIVYKKIYPGPDEYHTDNTIVLSPVI